MLFRLIFSIFSLIVLLDSLYQVNAIVPYLGFYRAMAAFFAMFFGVFVLSLFWAIFLWGIIAVFEYINRELSNTFILFINLSLILLFLVELSVVSYKFLQINRLLPDIVAGFYSIASIIFILSLALLIFVFRRKFNEYLYKRISVFYRVFIIFPLLGLILVLVTFAIGEQRASLESLPEPLKRPHYYNVLLIVIDEFDYALFSNKPDYPNISKFIDESYFFENAYSAADSTIASMYSIFNSRYDEGEHEFHKNILLDSLRENQFESYFIAPSHDLMRYVAKYGLLNNFDNILPPASGRNNYEYFYPWAMLDSCFYNYLGIQTWFSHIAEYYYVDRTTDALKRFIDLRLVNYSLADNFQHLLEKINYQKEDSFYWLHVFTLHGSNKGGPPPAFRDKKKSELRQNFLYFDHIFGKFIGELKKQKLYNKCAIILSADHGPRESRKNKNKVLYKKIYHIPLIIHLPGQKEGKVLKTLAGQVDLAPTILDLLGIEPPKFMEGESLVKYFNGAHSNAVKYSTTDFLDSYYVIAYKDDKKLIYSFDSQSAVLYNRVADSVGKYDVSTEYPVLVDQLRNRLLGKFSVYYKKKKIYSGKNQ